MEQKTPDFMKNVYGIFYLSSTDNKTNYWFNQFKDKIEENKKTGECDLYYSLYNQKKNAREYSSIIKIKNFDVAIETLNLIKYSKDKDDDS